MHHPRHHGPRPHHPPGHDRGGPGAAHWLFSAEQRASLAKAAGILTRFGAALAERGTIELRDDLAVSPPDPCDTLVRFERSPVGDLILKIELKWPDGEGMPSEDSLDSLHGLTGTAVTSESEEPS